MPTNKQQPINSKQIALVNVAISQLFLKEDEYHDILRAECGVESTKELTNETLDKLLRRFKKMGFKSTSHGHRQPYYKAPNGPAPDERPSPAQLQKINDLYDKLGWVEPGRCIGFNRKLVGHPWPQTRSEANKVIEAQKSMIARQKKMTYNNEVIDDGNRTKSNRRSKN